MTYLAVPVITYPLALLLLSSLHFTKLACSVDMLINLYNHTQQFFRPVKTMASSQISSVLLQGSTVQAELLKALKHLVLLQPEDPINFLGKQ